MQRQTTVAAGLLAMLAVAALIASPASAGQTRVNAEGGGTVTISPNAAIVDDEIVSVTGTGFEQNQSVNVSQCRKPATRQDCRWPYEDDDGTNGAGGFSVDVGVEAVFMLPNGETVDCRVADTCVLLVEAYYDDEPDPALQTVATPLDFDPTAPLTPAPTIAVAPAVDLLDAQTVDLTGSGFRPDRSTGFATGFVELLQCTTPEITDACAAPNRDHPFARVDANGAVDGRVRLRATIGRQGSTTDCRTTTCYLIAYETPTYGDFAAVALHFDPDGPLHDSRIRITVDPSSALIDGQTVQVDVTGFFPDEHPAIVLQCATAADGEFLGCTGGQTNTASPEGTLHLPFEVRQQFEGFDGGATVDCLVVDCFIGTGRPSGRFPEVRAALSFAGAAAEPATPTSVQPAFTG